jgi:hypothetical protein
MTTEQVNNTPDVKYKLIDKKTTKESSFYENIGTSKVISQDVLNKLEPKTYKDVTNDETMAKALKRINEGGANETINWFARDLNRTDNVDVA